MLNLHNGFIFEWETELVETAWLSFIGYLESGRSLKTLAGTLSCGLQQQYQIFIDISHKQADSVKDRPRSGHPQT